VVKCAECGFLAARNIQTREIEEVEGLFRDEGEPSFGNLGIPKHEGLPLCFARAFDLKSEFKKCAGKGDPDAYSIYLVIHEDRDCSSYTEWQQGFTPKEHREMLDRKWLMEFQAAREKEDKEWRESQRREDLLWREKQEKKAEKRHRTDLIIIGIVATILICLVTIIAAFIERGSLFP
jgi:hypothetical protein